VKIFQNYLQLLVQAKKKIVPVNINPPADTKLLEEKIASINPFVPVTTEVLKPITEDKTTLKSNDIWVYHYLSDVVCEQVREEGILKSAKVVFEEYMATELSQRALHPWKRIYWAYLQDTKKWLRTKREDSISDADVFAYLIWRAADNEVGKLDVTAGARAIYFTWTPMPRDIWMDTIAIDSALAEDRHDPLFSDRYGSHIAINLSALLRKYNEAKIFRVEFEFIGPEKEKKKIINLNHWRPTSKEEAGAWASKSKSEIWENFVPGDDFFRCVPHGAVVLPLGEISKEFIKCVDKATLINSDEIKVLDTKSVDKEALKKQDKLKVAAEPMDWYEDEEQQDDTDT